MNVVLLKPRSSSAFTPSQVPGLALWLKADGMLWQDSARTTPAVADTDPVGAWDDASGNGNHATQATGSSRPTLKLNVQNSRSAIRFDGVDDFLSAAAIDLSAAAALTVFAAYKQTAATDKVIYEHSADYNAIGTGFLFEGTNNTGKARVALHGNVGYSDFVSTASINGAWHCVSAVLDKSKGADQEVVLWVDGTSAGSASSHDNNTSTSWSSQTGYIGARAGAALFFDADLGELIIYPSALSDANRQLVEVYLKARWGTP